MHHTFKQRHGCIARSRRSSWPCSRRPPTSCLHQMMAQETLFRMINHSTIAEGYSLHGSVKRGGRPWRVMCQMFDFLFVVCVCRPWERERQTQKRPIFSPKSSHSHRGISTCEVSNTLQVSPSWASPVPFGFWRQRTLRVRGRGSAPRPEKNIYLKSGVHSRAVINRKKWNNNPKILSSVLRLLLSSFSSESYIDIEVQRARACGWLNPWEFVCVTYTVSSFT